MQNRVKVFAGNAGHALAVEVCRLLSIELGRAKVRRFNDGEVQVQILEDVRNTDVFIINPTNGPAENIFELALLCEAAHDSSAGRITIVPPYLAYNRQDRKDAPRVPISAHVVIDFLKRRGANRALLFDLHSEPTAAFFKPEMIVDHLYASTVSIPYLKDILPEPYAVASPDKGGGPRAEKYAALLGDREVVFFHKSRKKAGVVDEDKIRIIGDVKDKNVVFVDDMIDTGGTLIADAIKARQAGALNVYAFATHALFSNQALKRFDESPFTEIVVTDSIPHSEEELHTERMKITMLPLAPLMAQAIRRIHNGESLSELIRDGK